jgi:hypothetical protein
MFIRYFIFALLILFATNIYAQTAVRQCDTADDFPWLNWYQGHKSEIAERGDSDTSWLYVPVSLHIVGKDDGKGYFAVDQAMRAVCDMNTRFRQAHIRFYLKPGEALFYLDNTAWYDHNTTGGAELINQNKLPGRMNAFIVDDPNGACGYYWLDAIVLRKSCSGNNNSTWAHEAGHYFSLPHTFRGWENFDWDFSKAAPKEVNGRAVEKVDGSNCATSGDRFCDTKPDYLSDRWNCSSTSTSTTTQLDPDSIGFRSDGSLIMSYANDRCQSRFSPEQIAAMRANLRSQRANHLTISEPGTEIDDNAKVQLISPIDSQSVPYNKTELRWRPVTGADFYLVEVSLFSSFIVKLVTRAVFDATSLALPENMPKNRALYWRVRPYSYWDYCPGSTSDVQMGVFRTSDLNEINELARNTNLALAPNPLIAGTALSLSIDAESYLDGQLSIADGAGRILLAQPVQVPEGQTQITVGTEALPAGLYFLSVWNEKGAIQKRFVVVE